jgi:hypothetical protein
VSVRFLAVLCFLVTVLCVTPSRSQTTSAPNPPLNAAGASAPAPASQIAAAPQEKKRAKHVYTDDDFGAPPSDDLPPGTIGANNMAQYYLPKDPMTAKQLAALQQYANSQAGFDRSQSIAAISKLYLRDDDVPFRGRDDWNRRAFDAWTDIVKALSDFAQKLQAMRSQDAALLAQAQPSPQDVAQLHEQRIKLIEEWAPANKAVNHFIILENEAKDKAAEWKKYNAK